MKTARLCVMVLATVSLGGCGASLPSLSTGSLFGGTSKAATPVIQNDPTSRAIEVGSTSARAIKCGYNSDPAKLKNQFLTAEAATTPRRHRQAHAGLRCDVQRHLEGSC